MAKKKGKDKEQEQAARQGRTDQVRSAVDQAFQTGAAQGVAAAESGREAAQDIVDQLATAASRVRDVLDELRPPTGDDLRSLRESVTRLEDRVARLEAAQAAQPEPAKPARRAATGKAAPKRRSGGTTGKDA